MLRRRGGIEVAILRWRAQEDDSRGFGLKLKWACCDGCLRRPLGEHHVTVGGLRSLQKPHWLLSTHPLGTDPPEKSGGALGQLRIGCHTLRSPVAAGVHPFGGGRLATSEAPEGLLTT